MILPAPPIFPSFLDTLDALSKPFFLFITGSSGCGKTYLCGEIARRSDPEKVAVYHFDSVGVPSVEEMNRRFGSPQEWQKQMTIEWVQRLAQICDKKLIVLEGQYHPQFLVDACREGGIANFALAVVTCDELVWETRLRGPRNQPDLVTDDMRNWARMLRRLTQELGGEIIDTSESCMEQNLNDIARIVQAQIK